MSIDSTIAIVILSAGSILVSGIIACKKGIVKWNACGCSCEQKISPRQDNQQQSTLQQFQTMITELATTMVRNQVQQSSQPNIQQIEIPKITERKIEQSENQSDSAV